MAIMLTWRRGTSAVQKRGGQNPIAASSPARRNAAAVAGTAVFLTSDPESTPTALLHNLKHFQVLHEHNVI
jgi:KUP system potassium uptake protein